MVGTDYMLDKQKPPSPLKRLVNQRLIPMLIDASALLEGGIERGTVRVRQAPVASLLLLLGLGGSAGFLALRRSRVAP